MATKIKFGWSGKVRDSYPELVSAFPLASIKSDEHLQEAQQVMDGLLAKERQNGSTRARKCISLL